MTQIETIQAQLAQAQAENVRLREIAEKAYQHGKATAFSNGNSSCGMLSETAFKALTPLPDGIGKAMADVVRAAVRQKTAADKWGATPSGEISSQPAEFLMYCHETNKAVQAYQKMMEEKR